MTGNAFMLTKDTRIVARQSGKEVSAMADFLAARLKPATGLDFEVSVEEEGGQSAAISLNLRDDNQMGPEEYELKLRTMG